MTSSFPLREPLFSPFSAQFYLHVYACIEHMHIYVHPYSILFSFTLLRMIYLVIWQLHLSEVILYIFFSVMLSSYRVKFVRFIHIVTCSCSFFSFHSCVTFLLIFLIDLLEFFTYTGISASIGCMCCKLCSHSSLCKKFLFMVSFDVEIHNFNVGRFMNLFLYS